MIQYDTRSIDVHTASDYLFKPHNNVGYIQRNDQKMANEVIMVIWVP